MAKSLRFNRLRLALIASVSLIVVTNATFLIEVLSSSASILVPVLVFCFTFLPVYVVLLETMSRSNQSLALFRSVGAKKLTIAASLLVSLVGAGMLGAVVGTLVGLLLAGTYVVISPTAVVGLASTIRILPLAQGVGYVLGSFVAGLATAILFGVVFKWNKLS